MGQFKSTAQAPADAVAAKPDKSHHDADAVVSVEEVIAHRGSIQISSRYTTKRTLESEYSIDARVLGSGMSGPVQLAVGKTDGQKYAVKSLKKKGLSTRRRLELKSEVEIYLGLDHPHVARLEMVFESDEEIDLVMEYMAGGELYDRLSEQKHYTEELAADTTHQMLLAVAYLHAHQIAHRDLKLENFLYANKDSNLLKLIDFGFAKFYDRSTKMTQACGSVHYVAPEVLRKSYTEKADVWSLGVITYMLLTGSPPFNGSEEEVLRKIKAGKPHWCSRFQRLSEPAQSFVRSLLVPCPVERPTACDALEHPWIKDRTGHGHAVIDADIIQSLRNFAHSASFKRAVLSMLAWSLSTEDLADLRQQFLALDSHNRGTITHQEMKQVLEDTYHIDCDEAEALFRSLDTNNDNEIDYSEFLAAALQARVKVHEDMLRKTFHRFDQDECGRITDVDLREVLGSHFEGMDVTELIREVDTTGDGKINYDEFLAYFHKSDHPVEQELEHPAEPEVAPVTNELPAKAREVKDRHIEKIGKVIDGLIDDSNVPPSSPWRSPNPLNRKPPRTRSLPVLRRRFSTAEEEEDEREDWFHFV